MLLQPVIDVWRHTFPRDLRFCRQAMVLYAELNSVAKRYKDKKFIPRSEIQAVADNWVDVPYPWMRWPLIRQVTCIAWMNAYRVHRGDASWLFSRAVKAEHDRLASWLEREENRKMYVQSDVFQREVIEPFHVAALYHYVFLLVAAFTALLTAFLVACYNAETLSYLSLVKIRALTPMEIIEWFEKVAMQHCETELPDAYRTIMPPTAFVKPGDDTVYFNVVEMISPKGDRRMVFIPFPRIGPRDFFIRLGSIMKNHQAVIMEELTFEQLKVMPPAYFFPLKDEPFPALGVHHRYYDILEGGDRPPPSLLPGATPPEWYEKFLYGFVPFPIKTVYRPYGFMGTRGDARVGWGRIKDALHDHDLVSIAVPWTPMQITNLKCSLYKEGWRVGRVESVPWLRPRSLGETFLKYYNVVETDEHRARDEVRIAAERERRQYLAANRAVAATSGTGMQAAAAPVAATATGSSSGSSGEGTSSSSANDGTFGGLKKVSGGWVPAAVSQTLSDAFTARSKRTRRVEPVVDAAPHADDTPLSSERV